MNKLMKAMALMLTVLLVIVCVFPAEAHAAYSTGGVTIGDPSLKMSTWFVGGHKATTSNSGTEVKLYVTTGRGLDTEVAVTATATYNVKNANKYPVILSFTPAITSDSRVGESYTIPGTTRNWTGEYQVVMAAESNFNITVVTSALPGEKAETTLHLYNFTVTPVVSSTVTVNFNTMGTVKSSAGAVTSGTAFTVGTGGTTLTATAGSGNTFVAWTDANDKVVCPDAAYKLYPTAATTNLKAVFTKDTPYFMMTDTLKLVEGLDAAIAYANGAAKTAILMNNATLKADCEIPSNLTVVVPHNHFIDVYTTMPQISSGSTKLSAYKTLTLAQDVDLVVNGKLSVSAAQSSTMGHNGSPLGAVGIVKMNDNSTITVNSGAALYAWGYVYGSGSVTVNGGGTVYEDFQVTDWRGGTGTYNMLNNEQEVFPLAQYYVQNVQVPMTLYSGAVEKVITSMSITLVGNQSPVVDFISNSSGMFRIGTGGSITKDYDETNDRLSLVVNNGEITMGNITLQLKVTATNNATINSTDYILGLNHNIDITLKNGSSANVTQDFAMLPNSTLTVEEGATLTIANGTKLVMYAKENWGNYLGAGNSSLMPIKYAYPERKIDRTTVPFADAKLVVGGTVIATEGSIYTTTNDSACMADIVGTDESIGKFVTIAGSYATTYQATQTANGSNQDITYNSITTIPAYLTNSDGTGLATAGESQATTHYYAHGQWHTGTPTKGETVAATCTTDGYTVYTCNCATPQTYHDDIVAALGHDKESHVAKAPTCTEAGWDAYVTCKRDGCTYSTYSEKKALGHTDANNDGNHTCDREGCTAVVSTCADTNPKDHKCDNDTGCTATFGEHVQADGKHTCDYCGGTMSQCEDKTGDGNHVCDTCGAGNVTEHTYSNATCTTAATCTECGAVNGNPLNHKDENHDHVCDYGCDVYQGTHADAKTDDGDHLCDYCYKAVEGATCVDTNTDHICDNDSKCEAYSTGANAHKAAEGKHTCDYCGQTVTYCKESLTPTAQVSATCTTDGVKAYWTCTVCGTYYADSEATTKIADLETWKTTENQGKINQLGHDLDNGVESKAPTCTEPGVLTKSCSRCDYTETEAIVALGHRNIQTVEAVAPTCSEVGYTAGTYCNDCGTYTKGHDEVAIDPNAHSYGNWTITKEASCTEAGSQYRVCEHNAEHKDTQAITKLNHNMEYHAASNATCTTGGNNEYWYCSACETYYKDANGTKAYTEEDSHLIAALGHSMKLVEAAAKTCTTNGNSAYYDCENCDHYSNDEAGENEIPFDSWVIPASHDFNTEKWETDENNHYHKCINCTVTKDEAAHADGDNDHLCDECGYKVSECSDVTTDEDHNCDICKEAYDDHDYTTVVTAPTCTEQGYTTYNCNCGSSYTDNYRAALTHEWEVAAAVWNGTESASVTRTCKRDGCQATETATSTSVKAEVTTQPTYNAKGQTTYTATFNETWASAQKTLTDVPMLEGVAKVISGDTETNYGTLAEAMDNATDGDTIVLLQKYTVTGTETWDLTGKTLRIPTVEGNYGIVVKGDLTIVGGTFDVQAVYGIGVTGKLTVTGGTFNGAENVSDYIIGNWGTTSITGGEFNGWYCCVNNFDGGELTVSGGTFEATSGDQEIDGIVYESAEILADSGASITGGTFAQEPEADLIATGYCVKTNSDYTASVISHTAGEAKEENRTEPTCTTAGGYDTVVRCTNCNEVLSSETVTLDALTHQWKATDYKWEQVEGKWSCTATRSCGREGCGEIETANATVTSEVKTAATCTVKGWTTYTASFDVKWADIQTQKKQDIEMVAHTLVHVDKIDATCTDEGNIEYWYCSADNCGKFFEDENAATEIQESSVTVAVNPNNHSWSETITYGEATNNDESYSFNAMRTCVRENCTNKVEYTEDNAYTIVSHTLTPANCTNAGTDVYVVKFDAEWADEHEYSYDIPVNGQHVNGTPVTEKNIPAECEKPGSFDTVIYCTVCNAEVSRVTTTVVALEHDWDDGVYTDPTFEADGYTTYTCKHDANHTRVEPDAGSKLTAVAQIGEQKYQTLEEAIGAAQKGETIVLLASFAEAPTVEVDEEITIALNGNTITWIFANDNLRALKAIAADGFTVQDNKDGTYTFVRATVAEPENGEAAIGNTVYATLADAIADAKDGAFINLRADVAEVPSGINKNLVIIPNGYKLAGAESDTALTLLQGKVAAGYAVRTNYGLFFINKQTNGSGIVAKIGEVGYYTVKEALEAAKDGDTVVMVANSNESDKDIVVPSGVTLYLGTRTLNARSLTGITGSIVYGEQYGTSGGHASIITSNLILAEKPFVGSKGGHYLPVYISDGGMYRYVFVQFLPAFDYTLTDKDGLTINEGAKTLRFKFALNTTGKLRTYFSDVEEYRAADIKFKIFIQLKWLKNGEDTFELSFTFGDVKANTALKAGGNRYIANVTGYDAMGLNGDALDTLQVRVVVATESGAMVASDWFTK